MKVGILTLHNALNYGAVLQVTGLYTFLTRLGYDVEIINYIPDEIYGYYNYHIFSKPISIKSIVSKSIRYSRNKKETKFFKDFLNDNIKLSKVCKTELELKELCNNFDAIVCGSDQVWNPKATANLTKSFYLGIIENKNISKISYAASYGNINTISDIKEVLKNYLKDFDGISVREDEAVDITKELSGKDVEKLIDPSMLLNKNDYISKENKTDTPEQYVLTYKLNDNDDLTNQVINISKKLGIKIISLGKKIPGSIFKKDIGPAEFIYLYNNARFVVTNSFHGTVFSLIFNKPFLTFGNGNYNSRMETILKLTNQTKRLILDNKNIEELLKLLTVEEDYEFEKIIENERQKSKEFLEKYLRRKVED